MKRPVLFVAFCILAVPAPADVRIFVEDTNGLAAVRYECTAGEVVRAFALDVTVDRGKIVGITDFFRGLSTAAAQGYGIFPAAFRDFITVTAGTNANWDAAGYSPLADPADSADTRPGLNSSGVTLEFAAIWNPADPASQPPPSGTLCALQLSQGAHVTVAANPSRGGIVASPSEVSILPQFTGALVGPAITKVTLESSLLTIRFKGGELETTTDIVTNQWTSTGNTSGVYTNDAPAADRTRFYRVRQ
jgi:hypothetical protein